MSDYMQEFSDLTARGETFETLPPVEKEKFFRDLASFISKGEVDHLNKPAIGKIVNVGKNSEGETLWVGPTNLELMMERPDYARQVVNRLLAAGAGVCA